MTNVASLQLSLSDIARLADVKRPVVSMWRRRPLAGHSFPTPVGMVLGEERFDAREVAGYLAATGRGNNRDASEDLAAHAKLAHAANLDEVVTVHGLTALLCLATMTDSPLGDLSSGELHFLAANADPDDTFLLREIGALGGDLETLAAHADDLADASYSPSAAFERLLGRHAPSVYPGHAATTLVPAAQTLVARAAAALAAEAGEELPMFVDVTDGSGDLLLAAAITYAGELAPSVATLALDSPMGRLARRRLRVHDLHRLDVVLDEAGDFVVGRGTGRSAVHLVQLPPAGAPGLSDLEVLDTVGNLVAQLSDDSRVVVIGPASALTDRPASAESDSARDSVIRGDRLRAAIRLPKGLMPHSPRRALALWALGPAHAAVPVRDRWTVVADVSDQSLDESTIDGIVTDVVAAMTPDERSAKAGLAPTVAVTEAAAQVRGHQFRFARRAATSSLLPGRRSLVARAARSPRSATPAVAQAAAIDGLVAQLGPSLLDGLQVEARPEDALGARSRTPDTTIEQAMSDGRLRAIPGNRLVAEHLSSGTSGRMVIGPAEVLGDAAIGSRRIDLLTFAADNPSGRLTEPGDVVVCAGLRVGALVDTEGGSVVQAPARVLRITAAGRSHFLPAVLAVDVKRSGGPSSDDFRRWRLRVLTSEAVEALCATIPALDRERDDLLVRIAAVNELTATLIDAAASGAVAITATPSTSPRTLAKEGP